eukprot:388661_1
MDSIFSSNDLVGILIAVVSLQYVLGLFQLYGIYKFYSIKHLMIIRKRYPKIVMIEAIINVLFLMISLPLVAVNLFNVSFFMYSTHIGYTIYPILSHFIVNAEAARIWLIYFSLRHLDASTNQVWKSKIDATYSNNNWFLNNKHSFGNPKWVSIRICTYYIFAATVAIILLNMFGDIQWVLVIDGCLYGFPVLVVIYVYFKCPKTSKDYFLFHYEFKTTTIISIFGLGLYLSSQVISFIDFYLAQTINILAGNAVSFVSIISTLWIPKKILSQTVWNEKRRYSNTEKMIIEMNSSDKDEDTSVHEKLRNVLKNQNDLESFIEYLLHEFSQELILSFIECVQFKQYFNELCMQYDHKFDSQHIVSSLTSNIDDNNFELDGSIPKSAIVYTVNNLDLSDREEFILHFRNCSYLLFQKYIVVSSELEINISSRLRGKYYGMMNNKEMWINRSVESKTEIETLFDPVINEMFFLMIQSFSRYIYHN